MATTELDDVDRGILYLLQQDARNLTPVDIAERLPVSEGTVRNRIEKMEDRDVIQGYAPTIGYESAGYPLQVVFTCAAPVARQSTLAEAVVEIHGVVHVRELMGGTGNVEVVGVATDLADVMDIATELTERGLDIERQRLTLDEHVRPFNHFGDEGVDDDR